MTRRSRLALSAAALPLLTACTPPAPRPVRVATFNVEDVRTADLLADHNPRLARLAAAVRSFHPDIILLNEIAYDAPDSPDVPADQTAPGLNARRFADRYLAVAQGEGLAYHTWMPPVNTGVPSAHDLDRSGDVVSDYPAPGQAGDDAAPPAQTAAQRAYGNDCFGFGAFPGQYGMALLVRDNCTILTDQIRTYQLFRWSSMPDATVPTSPDGTPWYDPTTWADLRLPSKTLADVPVRLPDGSVLHCVISHPTPPAFDGPEGRNKARNRDEIRLLRAFLDNEPWLIDDAGVPGGLPPDAHAVVLGDLNADPEKGSSVGNPIATLLASSRLGRDVVPEPADPGAPAAHLHDTAAFALRVDYVLPTSEITVLRARNEPLAEPLPTDHRPVWADIILPAAKPAR